MSQSHRQGVCGRQPKSLIWKNDTWPCTCRTHACPLGMHPSLRASRQQATPGLSSTQGDCGVNDSFGHLHPSGNLSRENSASMTCTMSRGTEARGERHDEDRDLPKSRDTERDPGVAPGSPQLVLDLGGGVCSAGEATAWPRRSFPALFLPGGDHVTASHPQDMGRSDGAPPGWHFQEADGLSAV